VKHVRVAVEIDAPAGDVWPYVAEFRYWPSWGPTVSAVESEGAAVAEGVTGRVKTVAGFWLPFEITAVQPGRSWHWRVSGIPATGHRVVDLHEGRCRVELTVPWLLAPYVVVLWGGLRRLKALVDGVAEPQN